MTILYLGLLINKEFVKPLFLSIASSCFLTLMYKYYPLHPVIEHSESLFLT